MYVFFLFLSYDSPPKEGPIHADKAETCFVRKFLEVFFVAASNFLFDLQRAPFPSSTCRPGTFPCQVRLKRLSPMRVGS